MYLIRLIAVRYLFSKTNLSATRWISLISAVAIGVVTAALVCVLAVYNGYTQIILSSDQDNIPEYIITERTGKNFDATQIEEQLQHTGLSLHVSHILSTQGVLQMSGEQFPINAYGIDENYTEVVPLDLQVSSGNYLSFADADTLPELLIGVRLAHEGADKHLNDSIPPQLLFPKRKGIINPLAPTSAFISQDVKLSGIVNGQNAESSHSVYVSLRFIREILGFSNDNIVTAIAIRTPEGISESRLRQSLSVILPESMRLLNREEQQPARTFLIKSEKIMVYIIMVFVLILAAFNLSSSLVMLIIEKYSNIRTLRSMGASKLQITLIFTSTGLLTSAIGSTLGIIFGVAICTIQDHYNLLYTGEGLSKIPFPVDLRLEDLGSIGILTIIVSVISAMLPTLFLRSTLNVR